MKKRVFAGVLLCLAVMQLAVQYPAPVISQDVSVDATISITTVNATADLASLSQRDGMAVLIKTGDNAGLWRYSKTSTATVDDTTVLNGPGSVGRFLQITIAPGAGSLDVLHDLTGKTAADLDPDATIEFVYYDVNEGTSYKVPLDELRKKGDVSTVANVAALFVATHARDDQLFQTLGYSTEGIGANLYRYDASSTATIDGGFVLPGPGGTLSFSGTTFNGTAGTGRFVAVDQRHIYAEHFGAIGDGLTDASQSVLLAVKAATASTRTVHFGAGAFVIGDVHLPGVSVFGDNDMGTRIIAKSGASYIFRLGKSPNVLSYGWDQKVIQNIKLHGDYTSRSCDGLKWGDDTNPQLSGSWTIRSCSLSYFNRALYKPDGNIGNTFDKINIFQSNYGMYAKANSAPMHCGNDTWRDGEISSCDYAAIYYDGTDESATTTGGISFENTIIEGNAGIGIYIKGVRGEVSPLTLSRVYFELNGTASSVIIDGDTLSPVDVYLDATYAKLDNCGINSMTLVGSHVTSDFCKLPERGGVFSAAEFSMDDNSSLVVDNYRYTYHIAGDYTVSSIANQIYRSGYDQYPAGVYCPFFRATHRTNVINAPVRGGTVVASEMFDKATSYAFSPVVSTSVVDGLLHRRCAELTVPDNSNTQGYSNGIFKFVVTPAEASEWFVLTGGVKCVGFDPATSGFVLSLTGYGTQVIYLQLMAKQDEWVTVGGVFHGVDTTAAGVNPSNGDALYLYNNTASGDGGSSITVRLADWQLVRFTKFSDAVEYFNSRTVTDNNSNKPIELYGTGSPEGVVTAIVGSRFYRTDGGTSTTLYIKETGTGNTGWVAK